MSASGSRPNRFTRPPIRPQPSRPPPGPAIAGSSSRPSQTTIASSSSSTSTSTAGPPLLPPPPPHTISPPENVGTYLALIASSLQSSLSLLATSDQSHWSADEDAQVRALQEVLTQAGRDFQMLSALVGGGMYFELDTGGQTLGELRVLVVKFRTHEGLFGDWVRAGGPINPLWVRETRVLGRELGRAMRRGARRIWEGTRLATEDGAGRCLGGEVVWTAVRREREEVKGDRGLEERGMARWLDEGMGVTDAKGKGKGREGQRRGSLEAVVPECNSVGRFERLGDEDVAFVCDYCDGSLMWTNLADVPTQRSLAGSLVEGYPNWAATGRKVRVRDGEEEAKTVVFAPLAIGNHVPPKFGDWMSRLICPYCEAYTYIDAGDDGGGERKWVTEQGGFETMAAFQEHLQWSHTALPKPALPFSSEGKCAVM